MNKKTLFLLIVVLIIVVLILIFVFKDRNTEQQPPSPPIGSLPPPALSTSTIPSGDNIVIGTKNGGVSVRNFYKDPIEVATDDRSVLIVSSVDYYIDYFAPDGSFAIVILRKPVDEVRKVAEKDFLKKLNVSQADACKLNVSVGVPISVDENLAGLNLGLSFCISGI